MTNVTSRLARNFTSTCRFCRRVLWLCLLGWFQPSAAQIPKTFSVQLTAGAAFPLGKFGTADFTHYPTTDANGSAIAGPAAKAKLSYQLNRSFGLALSVGWQQNGRNSSVFLDTLKMRYPAGNYYRAHYDPWVMWNGMLGAFFLVPLKEKKMYLRPEVNAGMAKTSVPGLSYAAFQLYSPLGQGTSGYMGKISMPWSFCYDAGVDLQWTGTPHLFYSGGLSFFHTVPHWKYNYTPSFGAPGTPETTNYPISTVQVSLSAGYRF